MENFTIIMLHEYLDSLIKNNSSIEMIENVKEEIEKRKLKELFKTWEMIEREPKKAV